MAVYSYTHREQSPVFSDYFCYVEVTYITYLWPTAHKMTLVSFGKICNACRLFYSVTGVRPRLTRLALDALGA